MNCLHDALNALVNRTFSKYSIQMDEYMIFFDKESADKMVNNFEKWI